MKSSLRMSRFVTEELVTGQERAGVNVHGRNYAKITTNVRTILVLRSHFRYIGLADSLHHDPYESKVIDKDTNLHHYSILLLPKSSPFFTNSNTHFKCGHIYGSEHFSIHLVRCSGLISLYAVSMVVRLINSTP
ncbi:hypothetical protein CEXT_599481 [Caerostris extrusa]|uniref:Uncharacterized protein n=1 Tax=Caerostris extrusa TaxID=172846 RepID=A0AAV4T9M8_CAEEX|nr:hypothetical protein CEXT_599481 [Caerostris extrusa]